MSIGDPLSNAAAGARKNADEDSDNGAAEDEPEMAECILDAFHYAAAEIFRRALSRNRCPPHREVDDLGYRKNSDEHRDKIKTFPQIHHAEIETERAGLA